MPWRLLTAARSRRAVRDRTWRPGRRPPTNGCSTASSSGSSARPASRRTSTRRCNPTPRSARRSHGPTSTPDAFDGLILPGGHAPGMRQYLGSELAPHAGRRLLGARPTGRRDLSRRAGARPARPIGAPGAAFSTGGARRASRSTWSARRSSRPPGGSVATTARTPRTSKTRYDSALRDPGDFVRGPLVISKRGTGTDDRPAFVVEDGNYVSARWPGDAYAFAKRFAARLGR